MILYSINYCGPLSNYEWSIVTIYKSLEVAEQDKTRYEENMKSNGGIDYKYRIIEIDTDSPSDCIYDYDAIDE